MPKTFIKKTRHDDVCLYSQKRKEEVIEKRDMFKDQWPASLGSWGIFKLVRDSFSENKEDSF